MTSTFPFDVASGDVSHGDVVLWTKLAAPGDTVRWHLEPADGGPTTSGESGERPHHRRRPRESRGARRGHPVSLQFESGDEKSPEGRFATIPTDRPVRFAVVSCAKYNSGFFNAYRAVAELDDIDFVLHLGDYIDEAAQIPTGKQTAAAGIGRLMDPPGDCMTRDDDNLRYALYRGMPTCSCCIPDTP
jgi:phosphodiesterase/alkaline phosphatase D-like protein